MDLKPIIQVFNSWPVPTQVTALLIVMALLLIIGLNPIIGTSIVGFIAAILALFSQKR